jgi:hypothetical protein
MNSAGKTTICRRGKILFENIYFNNFLTSSFFLIFQARSIYENSAAQIDETAKK